MRTSLFVMIGTSALLTVSLLAVNQITAKEVSRTEPFNRIETVCTQQQPMYNASTKTTNLTCVRYSQVERTYSEVRYEGFLYNFSSDVLVK